MAIKHTGNGFFVDTEPVAPPDGTPDDPDLHIYAFARFRSLEHVSYGLMRTAGGPEDEGIDFEEVGEYGMDPLNPFWEFAVALDEIEGANRAKRGSESYLFEEVPYVEVTTEEEYNEALDALELEEDEGDIFDGPGLYDFRDSPPSYQGTVEENELMEMERAADDAIEFMFQGDQWEEAYAALADEEG